MINDLTVIIITFQEEANIKACVESVRGVTENIFVVDSYSSDGTQKILNELGVRFLEHGFTTYADKRNWSQTNNPFKTKWVMHLDADERLTPELSKWLLTEFSDQKERYDAFLFSRKTIFLNRWIKYGGQYPNFHMRLFKANIGYCEEKAYDQHFVANSNRVSSVPGADIVNTVASTIDDLILSHNGWASREASEIISSKSQSVGEVKPKILGNAIERRRWLKTNIFHKMPLFLRSFIYFGYRYFLRAGFLDGKEGLIFFVLQTFWFRFLVDAKVFETKTNDSKIDN